MSTVLVLLYIGLTVKACSGAGRNDRYARLRKLHGEPQVVYDENSPSLSGYTYDVSGLPSREGQSFGAISPQSNQWNTQEGGTPYDSYRLPPRDYYGGGGERTSDGGLTSRQYPTAASMSMNSEGEYISTPRPGSFRDPRRIVARARHTREEEHRQQQEGAQVASCTEAMGRMGVQGEQEEYHQRQQQHHHYQQQEQQYQQRGIHIGPGSQNEPYEVPPDNETSEGGSSGSRRRRDKGKKAASHEEGGREVSSEDKQMRRAMRQSRHEHQLRQQQQQQQPWTRPFLTQNSGEDSREFVQQTLEIPMPRVNKMIIKYFDQLGNVAAMSPAALAEKISELRIHQRAFDEELGRLAELKVAEDMSAEYLHEYQWWAKHYTNTITGLRKMLMVNKRYESYQEVDKDIFDKFADVAREILTNQAAEPLEVQPQARDTDGEEHQQQSQGASEDTDADEDDKADEEEEGDLSIKEKKARWTDTWEHYMQTKVREKWGDQRPAQLSTAFIEATSRGLQWDVYSANTTKRYLTNYMRYILKRTLDEIKLFRRLRKEAIRKARENKGHRQRRGY